MYVNFLQCGWFIFLNLFNGCSLLLFFSFSFFHFDTDTVARLRKELEDVAQSLSRSNAESERAQKQAQDLALALAVKTEMEVREKERAEGALSAAKDEAEKARLALEAATKQRDSETLDHEQRAKALQQAKDEVTVTSAKLKEIEQALAKSIAAEAEEKIVSERALAKYVDAQTHLDYTRKLLDVKTEQFAAESAAKAIMHEEAKAAAKAHEDKYSELIKAVDSEREEKHKAALTAERLVSEKKAIEEALSSLKKEAVQGSTKADDLEKSLAAALDQVKDQVALHAALKGEIKATEDKSAAALQDLRRTADAEKEKHSLALKKAEDEMRDLQKKLEGEQKDLLQRLSIEREERHKIDIVVERLEVQSKQKEEVVAVLEKQKSKAESSEEDLKLKVSEFAVRLEGLRVESETRASALQSEKERNAELELAMRTMEKDLTTKVAEAEKHTTTEIHTQTLLREEMQRADERNASEFAALRHTVEAEREANLAKLKDWEDERKGMQKKIDDSVNAAHDASLSSERAINDKTKVETALSSAEDRLKELDSLRHSVEAERQASLVQQKKSEDERKEMQKKIDELVSAVHDASLSSERLINDKAKVETALSLAEGKLKEQVENVRVKEEQLASTSKCLSETEKELEVTRRAISSYSSAHKRVVQKKPAFVPASASVTHITYTTTTNSSVTSSTVVQNTLTNSSAITTSSSSAQAPAATEEVPVIIQVTIDFERKKCTFVLCYLFDCFFRFCVSYLALSFFPPFSFFLFFLLFSFLFYLVFFFFFFSLASRFSFSFYFPPFFRCQFLSVPLLLLTRFVSVSVFVFLFVCFALHFSFQESIVEQKSEPALPKGKGKGKGKKNKTDKPEQKNDIKIEQPVVAVVAAEDAETKQLEALSKQAAETAVTAVDDHFDNAEFFVAHVADLEGINEERGNSIISSYGFVRVVFYS